MKRTGLMALAGLVSLLMLAGCGSPSPEKVQVTVAAAMSLQGPLVAIGELYEKANPRVQLIFDFASSGTLQQQIQQGAPVDLFISAGQKQIEMLAKEGLTSEDSRVNLTANKLVLIMPLASTKKIKDIADLADREIKSIAIGNPDTVPAGQYARESLINLDLWPTVAARLIYAKDVRQVLAYVETGNVDAGLVYRSDAIASPKVRVVTEAPENSHSPIIYPAVLLREGPQKEEAKQFLAFLRSNQAQKIFEEFGFLPVQ